jgi:hypothetical protein
MQCLSKTDIETMLDGFQYVTKCDLHTVVMWVEIGQIGLVRSVFESKGYTNVQMITWYKVGINVVGPVFRFTPATEVCLIAYKGELGHASKQFNLSKDPLQRHNIIMGPPKRVLSKNAQGQEINMFEKPDYLASKILSMFCKSGQWVVVAGFGAGGDVRGAVNAGLNVVAIEADPQQYEATLANMRNFVPKDDLSMVITPDQLSQVAKTEIPGKVLGAGQDFWTCQGCGVGFTGEPIECKHCGESGCVDCFSGLPPSCRACRLDMEREAASSGSPGIAPDFAAAAAQAAEEASAANDDA